MKLFGGAVAFKQFTSGKGINYYPIDNGAWYGISNDNRYIKKLGKKVDSEYVVVAFENLNDYLQSLDKNTKDNPYKIYVTNATIKNLGNSGNTGTLGNIIKNNNRYISLKLDIPENFTDAHSMFAGCSSLTEIDTTPFTNVTNAEGMFYGCTSLIEIDTTPFTNVNNSYAYDMFNNCTLTAYYSSEDDNIYKNCRDIVGGNITWTLKNK